MEKRHKNLTDSQRLERLAWWLDDEYRLGVKMSEDAVSDVVSDLKRIAAQIKRNARPSTNKQSTPCSDCRFRHNQLHCGYCTRAEETEYGDYYEKE